MQRLEWIVPVLARSLEDFESMRDSIQPLIGIPPYLALLGRGWSYSTVNAGGYDVTVFRCGSKVTHIQ